MKNEFFAEPGIVENIYDSSLRTIIATWSNLGPHEFVRPCVRAQLELVQKNPIKVLIVDTFNSVGVIKSIDQEWLGEEMFPRFEDAGLRAILTIPSKSALSRLSSSWYQKTGEDFGIEFIEVGSRELALEKAHTYV